MKNSITKTTAQIGESLRKNSPIILTGLGVAGIITTAAMAVKATPKAISLLDEKLKEETNDKNFSDDRPSVFDYYTKKEIVKTVWKRYIPATIMGGITAICIIGANKVNLKRNAALASLYSITEKGLKEYQAKVVKTIGENKEKKIRDEVAKEKLNKNPISSSEIIITGKGETLCYDALSGRYFKNDIENIRKIMNRLNRDMLSEMFMSLNDVYYELNLQSIKLGDIVGWHVDGGLIEPEFSSHIAEDGTPCLVLDFNVEPRYFNFG